MWQKTIFVFVSSFFYLFSFDVCCQATVSRLQTWVRSICWRRSTSNLRQHSCCPCVRACCCVAAFLFLFLLLFKFCDHISGHASAFLSSILPARMPRHALSRTDTYLLQLEVESRVTGFLWCETNTRQPASRRTTGYDSRVVWLAPSIRRHQFSSDPTPGCSPTSL